MIDKFNKRESHWNIIILEVQLMKLDMYAYKRDGYKNRIILKVQLDGNATLINCKRENNILTLLTLLRTKESYIHDCHNL